MLQLYSILCKCCYPRIFRENVCATRLIDRLRHLNGHVRAGITWIILVFYITYSNTVTIVQYDGSFRKCIRRHYFMIACLKSIRNMTGSADSSARFILRESRASVACIRTYIENMLFYANRRLFVRIELPTSYSNSYVSLICIHTPSVEQRRTKKLLLKTTNL